MTSLQALGISFCLSFNVIKEKFLHFIFFSKDNNSTNKRERVVCGILEVTLTCFILK
jgi:hypothetical protein